MAKVAGVRLAAPFGLIHKRQERRADAWAALRLIDLDDYRAAEESCGGHAGHIAVELGVMRSIVVAYQGLLLRMADRTYLGPRMGAGQWDARVRLPDRGVVTDDPL